MRDENEILEFIRGELVCGFPVRVPVKLARKWLLENTSLVCGAYVFYLQICNIGLGVCEVQKAPLTVRKTKMIKE